MGAPRRSPVRRAGQVLTGLGALVVLVGVLAGGPVALLAFAGNPLPDHLPTLAEVGTALTSRDDGRLFLRALAVVGWFGWATFAFSVVVELLAAAVRRPAPKLPGMHRQQKAAAALVGSVALILVASPAAASAAALTAPQPAVAAVTSPAVAASQVTPPAPIASKADDPAVYRVAKGDYLGEVADRYLDDFDRYKELARLNRLADPDRIRPGQLITLPEGATDSGARRHATGRIVVTKPAETAPVKPGGGGASSTTPKAKPKPTPRDATPTVEAPVGQPPAMSAGASRATAEEGINRPLAISAVLAVASIVGAQIGALLGLRKRPVPARALSSGRHRRD
ncbi:MULTISPECIES: LysM peptidoglycan-binding domain-containing protein [Micromonospora]|uniref:LysM peptidoglycan-binding domain-containing protein n=1 Tax=Micromonospora TaxID=1873 RepID=UPI0001C45CA5|nr:MULTISPECIES: LysM peptidoglycan-binding domain-containing protein [Micromonospora]ADU05788.1 Peptidoglycan-binding lysin domain protein [Micromonospora sp. L5]RNI02588.1 LysM peptidoglycan-binding domain-containing protein [Micromonospora aurantiaca]